VGIAGKAVPPAVSELFSRGGITGPRTISAPRTRTILRNGPGWHEADGASAKTGRALGDPHLAAVRAAAADIAASSATLRQARIRQPTALGFVSWWHTDIQLILELITKPPQTREHRSPSPQVVFPYQHSFQGSPLFEVSMKPSFVGWGPLCDFLVRRPQPDAPAWSCGSDKPTAGQTHKIKP
jgi:hypothetical protein